VPDQTKSAVSRKRSVHIKRTATRRIRNTKDTANCGWVRSAQKCSPADFFHPPGCHSKPATHSQAARLSLKFMQTNTAECQMSECSAVASDNRVATGRGGGGGGTCHVNAWVGADNKLQLLIKGSRIRRQALNRFFDQASVSLKSFMSDGLALFTGKNGRDQLTQN